MEPLNPPKTFNCYILIKQDGLALSWVYGNNTVFGSGFFSTRTEAEQYRTLQILKDTNALQTQFHVFELTIPNPAYKQ